MFNIYIVFILYHVLVSGKIGDWKNYFTVKESEMFDEVIERELVDTGIQFQF